MRAAEVGVLPIVQALLKHGAGVDEREQSYGQTALMFAARAGHADVVAALLARGARPNVATDVGPTPASSHRTRCRDSASAWASCGVVCRRTAVAASPWPAGMTPLLYAARMIAWDVAKLLIEAGADVNAKEANGIWPLLMAVSQRQRGRGGGSCSRAAAP